MTTAARSSRWSRRFVFAGAIFFVCWQVATLADLASRTTTVLGLLGFVFHTVFGKAYSLLPTYFDREIATTRFMPAHLALATTGVVLLAVAGEHPLSIAGTLGGVAWGLAVLVFLATMAWTIKDNPTGAETATGESNADLRAVDRTANLFMPVALAYLAAGSYALMALTTGLPVVFDGYAPRSSHLLAAGGGALLIFAVGFRLLPRFLVATPPLALVAVVLPAGAIAPAMLAWQLPAGRLFQVGALLQSIAVVGFAVAFWVLYYRSERRRVGFYGVLACTVAGVSGVGLGVCFAVEGPTAELVVAHRRLNLVGFLGLAIVGVSYQFYPPAVGTFPGAGDRTALAAMALIFVGVLAEAAALAAGIGPVVTAGELLVLAGGSLHLFLLGGLFDERYG